jgi:hypothetical protein
MKARDGKEGGEKEERGRMLEEVREDSRSLNGRIQRGESHN